MLYTLLKFLGWGTLLACIGVCIGWALRSLKCRGEVARATASDVDSDEVERLRLRLADLETVVAERDRLRIQLADVRHADSPGIVGGDIPAAPSPDNQRDAESQDRHEEPDEADVASGEEAKTTSSLIGSVEDVSQPDENVDTEEPQVLDLDAAAHIIGKKVALDDLTVVEGIGPKISELCSGIGITTWRRLADTDIADLQSMLDAAGSRYSVHKPGTWPRQAALLAAGRWAEFTTATDELEGGS